MLLAERNITLSIPSQFELAHPLEKRIQVPPAYLRHLFFLENAHLPNENLYVHSMVRKEQLVLEIEDAPVESQLVEVVTVQKDSILLFLSFCGVCEFSFGEL
jgi:hypothetical protein